MIAISHTSLSRSSVSRRDWPATTNPPFHLATTMAVRAPASGCQVICCGPRVAALVKKLAGKLGIRPCSAAEEARTWRARSKTTR